MNWMSVGEAYILILNCVPAFVRFEDMWNMEFFMGDNHATVVDTVEFISGYMDIFNDICANSGIFQSRIKGGGGGGGGGGGLVCGLRSYTVMKYTDRYIKRRNGIGLYKYLFTLDLIA